MGCSLLRTNPFATGSVGTRLGATDVHDYDPNWDYLVCELDDVPNISAADRQEVLKLIEATKQVLLPMMGFSDMEVFFVEPGGFGRYEDESSRLAVYCNGTSSRPVIGLDLDAIQIGCNEMGISFLQQVEVSIAHELAHAYQETVGAEDRHDFGEDSAEEFARNWIDFREVDPLSPIGANPVIAGAGHP